jgi:hypothetical protein
MSAIGEPVRAEPVLKPISHVQWPAIFAGAVAAAGLSIALNAFAAGIGLSVVSTSPTWRDSSPWFSLVAGLYVLFVALMAFGLGGYVAGRMRAPLNVTTPEMEFRDGVHGLITWGLAVMFTAVFAFLTASVAASAISPAPSAPSQSVVGESVIATELDELFRSDRTAPDLTYRRAEAARILLKASGHSGVPDGDRAYLAVITANSAGISLDEARARVDREAAAAKDALHKARVAAVLQAFFIAVALFAGAAVAWFSACEGGRDRERGTYPVWDWSYRRRM